MEKVRLGLIGDHIAASRAPRLYAIAGRMRGVETTYDLLVPAELGIGFDALFERCAAGDYHGINITYPYKERAAARVAIESPLVRAIGAVNTIVFAPDGPRGLNTDHTGFIAAWRARFEPARPGVVCQVGAGGVGRAVAFGLAELGATAIRLFDLDHARAERLAAALRDARPETETTVAARLEDAAAGAHGLVNCSPVGMVGHEGSPVPIGLMEGAEWAFDAVYTPVDTRFLADAAASGLATLSGYELFFEQGQDGIEIFLGGKVDRARLRQALAAPA